MHWKENFLTLILIISISRSDSSCFVSNTFEHDTQNFRSNEKNNYIPEYSDILVVNNYGKHVLSSSDRLFSSACVKCLLCQTIAREYHRVLQTFHYTGIRKLVYYSETFNNTLKTFCDNSFVNFDLREYKENRFIEASSKSSKHVPCGVEGLWPKKLKEMCRTFMDDSDEWTLYHRWISEVQKPNFDETNFLCRSYGLFQHCRNLNIPPKIDKNYQRKSKYTIF